MADEAEHAHRTRDAHEGGYPESKSPLQEGLDSRDELGEFGASPAQFGRGDSAIRIHRSNRAVSGDSRRERLLRTAHPGRGMGRHRFLWTLLETASR